MLTNYLKIAWRNLVQAKEYTIINIVGLSMGMAASAVIFLWIQDELRYDQFYTKSDRLFQVYNRDVFSGKPSVWGNTPGPLAPELQQNYPEIEAATRFCPLTLLISANDKHINIPGAFADPAFFSLFDLPFLRGNPAQSLSQTNGIVITKTMAETLFGTTDVIGKTIQLEHKDNFTVAGVLDDLPDNSQFGNVDYFLPWAYFKSLGWSSDEWSSNNYFTYVLLHDKAKAETVNAKIKRVTAMHLKGVLDDVSNRTIFLHPASKWHLYSKVDNGQLVDGQIITVRLFGIIAAFILLIACVNFVNLSTARSEKRAKEVGVRKVAGAERFSLVLQFMSESILLTLLSGVVAILVVWAGVPVFNTYTQKQLGLDLGSAYFWMTAVGFMLFTGVLAGAYPAFVLSGFQPMNVMKGTYKSAKAVLSPRRALVVTQFVFAIVLIIATLVIKQQISYAQERDSGYDRTNVLFTVLSGTLEKHYDALRQELLDQGAAISATKSLGHITGLNARQWGVSWPGSIRQDKDVEFDLFGADRDFMKTMGTRLRAGREIDVSKYPSDSSALVLNETAVKTMRLANPLGVTIRYQNKDWRVVGVVQDFIFDSPYQPVKPVIIGGPGGELPLQWVSIRLNPRNSTAKNIDLIERICKKYNPGYPVEYTFADEPYNAKFAQEQQTGLLITLFSGLAIFISCLGLFGLAAFTAQQRTKEIGVRKVLGATVRNVVWLLTKDYLTLVGIAFAFATPVGWYAMNKWLNDYEYRISLGVGVFVVTLLCATLIVVLTVSYQATKAALMNPVKSLRSE